MIGQVLKNRRYNLNFVLCTFNLIWDSFTYYTIRRYNPLNNATCRVDRKQWNFSAGGQKPVVALLNVRENSVEWLNYPTIRTKKKKKHFVTLEEL